MGAMAPMRNIWTSGVLVVGDGYQSHADGRSLAAAAAVTAELDAVTLQLLAHFGAGIDAGDAPFQVRGSGVR